MRDPWLPSSGSVGWLTAALPNETHFNTILTYTLFPVILHEFVSQELLSECHRSYLHSLKWKNHCGQFCQKHQRQGTADTLKIPHFTVTAQPLVSWLLTVGVFSLLPRQSKATCYDGDRSLHRRCFVYVTPSHMKTINVMNYITYHNFASMDLKSQPNRVHLS